MTIPAFFVSAPAPAASTGTEHGPAARTSLLERVPPRAFRLIVLGVYAAGMLLASSGIQRMASLRSNYYLGQVRARAVSPLRYGTRLAALNALAVRTDAHVRIIIRADSAGDGSRSLCALAAALGSDPRATWVAKSRRLDGCIARGARRSPVAAGATAAAELSRARWALLGAGGHVLHSGWDVPDAKTLLETASLFATTHRSPPIP